MLSYDVNVSEKMKAPADEYRHVAQMLCRNQTWQKLVSTGPRPVFMTKRDLSMTVTTVVCGCARIAASGTRRPDGSAWKSGSAAAAAATRRSDVRAARVRASEVMSCGAGAAPGVVGSCGGVGRAPVQRGGQSCRRF